MDSTIIGFKFIFTQCVKEILSRNVKVFCFNDSNTNDISFIYKKLFTLFLIGLKVILTLLYYYHQLKLRRMCQTIPTTLK